ncbi:MAG: hypothetical protein IAG13_15705 [Deltaproteobacteria bacterium]|nr:hypothetical protein [Nannocystaceae bacterium]
MSISTSDDLHPATGARFVFEREQAEPPRYRVKVFLPAGELLGSTLRWEESRPCFEPPLPPGWPADEATKLARVLHREPQSRLVRWRGPA